jgi:putative beta-barrel porin BBP2
MKALAAALFLLCLPAGALAQSPEPPSNVRMHLGPLFVNPTLALTNAGVDTNVFNEATVDSPKEDYTATLTPSTDVWLRMGRSWLYTTVREDLVYYQKYVSERSVNSSYKASWLIPLNRITFTPTASFAHTRERPGFEVDARARRNEYGFGGAVEIRALSKTFVTVRATTLTDAFDKDAIFLGTSLRDALNRTITQETLSIRNEVTPLTSFTIEATREQDRFEFSPLRNSDSTQLTFGVKFDPAALIKGGATFGFQDFQPRDGSLAGYKGTTLAADLSYVLLGITKFAVKGARDIQYSYDINQPYYLQTGANIEISQQIAGPFDAVARVGAARLEYRDRTGAVVAVSNRVDHIETYGGGFGYHIGHGTRIGFNVDEYQRLSPLEGREYKGLKYGIAVTYGS